MGKEACGGREQALRSIKCRGEEKESEKLLHWDHHRVIVAFKLIVLPSPLSTSGIASYCKIPWYCIDTTEVILKNENLKKVGPLQTYISTASE